MIAIIKDSIRSLKEPRPGADTGPVFREREEVKIIDRKDVTGSNGQPVNVVLVESFLTGAKGWLRATAVISDFEPPPPPVQIDKNVFAIACLDAARSTATNVHFLLALAHLKSGIKNSIKTTDNVKRFGPFQLSLTEWDNHRVSDRFKVNYTPLEIFDPTAQADVAHAAARFVAACELAPAACCCLQPR